MPPLSKYSKEEIADKALDIIRTAGVEKLTARELASALGTSAKPIFTAFENMEDVKHECFIRAFNIYHSIFKDGLGDEPFKQLGFLYIKFAINEPKLYQFIFLQSQDTIFSFNDYMRKMDDCYDDSLKMIADSFQLDFNQAEQLYKHLWIYATGIATLCATKQCIFNDKEINDLLDTACQSFSKQIACN